MFTIHSRFAAFYSALRAKRAKPIPDFTDSIAEIKREGEVFGPRNRASGEEFENHLRDMQSDMEAELADQGKRPTTFVRKLKGQRS